jgi:PEP-CTERM motif
MPSRFLRVLLSVAATAVFVAVNAPARGADYSPAFDPQFDGTALFRINNSCLLSNGTFFSSEACHVDMIFANMFDTNFPNVHYTSGFQPDIAFEFVIGGNQLTQFQTLDPGLSCPVEGPCAAQLEFFIGCDFETDDSCLPLATLKIGDRNPLNDGYRLDRVPEPGTLSLLLGGLGAVWMRKRRKAVA